MRAPGTRRYLAARSLADDGQITLDQVEEVLERAREAGFPGDSEVRIDYDALGTLKLVVQEPW